MSRPVHRTELSPVSFLDRSARVFPDKTAVVHGTRRYSYAELATRCRRLASALGSAGLASGDRVALLSPNTPAMLEAHFGVPLAGGVLVPINVRLTSPEIGYILGHSGARFLLADAALTGSLEGLDLTGVRVVRVNDTGAPGDPYEDLLASGDPSGPSRGAPEDEDALISINYTSGTTGRPKGVMCTHRGAHLNALGDVLDNGLTDGTVYLWTLPMFHGNGWCFTWAVTAVGGTHVCLRAPDPARIWELLEAEGVTHMCSAPTVQIGVAHHAAARPLTHTVTVAMGGAPPSPTLLARLRELGFHPTHLYGLTETYTPLTSCVEQPGWAALDEDARSRLLARQGHSHLLADPVRVVDEKMGDVPRDAATLGEVVARGNTVMRGYYDDPEATDEAFRGGWFHTGDVAVWHPDGYIELRDRIKDVVISGGENISTIEVEQVVCRHPAVLECAVVAMPDERWGERPKAFVALKDGAQASAEEIIDFCRANLAHFKCPDAVAFGELPKTSTGKVQKYVLRGDDSS